MSTLDETELDRLSERGEILAVLVSPELLKDMLGNRLGSDDMDIMLHSVTTFGDRAVNVVTAREYLIVSPTLMLVKRDAA